MAKFILKEVSPSLFHIVKSRGIVGKVFKTKSGQWTGRLNGVSASEPMSTPSAMFRELVARSNRISICGANDAALARKTLAEENRKLQEEVEAMNRLVGFKIARVKRSKVHI